MAARGGLVSAERQRIDRWLFFTRVVKSRSLAAKLARSGRVRVNRIKIAEASHMVKVGDVLTITLERKVRVLEVLDGGTRRGPYAEAQGLYRDLTPAPATQTANVPAETGPPRREAGTGRPTKRDRRQMDALRRGD